MYKFKILYLMKVLAFGDSFVKMFIHCEPQVKQWKFKGKSVKGLVKQNDLERKRIERQIRKASNGTKILLIFGQVDFNYVRYYKVIKGEPPITEETFKKYVQWVSSMNYRKNISIVSIFASPIKKQYIVASLINKGSYTLEEQTNQIDQKIKAEYENSHEVWQRWNAWISSYCEKYKVCNIKLFDKNELKPQFYDVSNLTIHLRYVPVLKLVKKHIDITFDAEKAEQIQKEYQKEKVDRIVNSTIKINNKDEQSIAPLKENDQKSLTAATVQTNEPEVQLSNSLGNNLIKECQRHQQFNVSQQSFTQQIQKLKSQRKNTADIETATTTETQSIKQKQDDNVRSNSNEPTESKKTKKKTNKKKEKRERQKQKKKFVQKQKVEVSESEDQGQRFLQLTVKSTKKY